MPPPFYQPRVSKGGFFDLFGVTQYGIVHGLYLCQVLSLVYFDLCVHGSLKRGGDKIPIKVPLLKGDLGGSRLSEQRDL